VGHPVEPVLVHLATGGAKFCRQLLAALLAPVEVDDVSPGYVTEGPNPPDLNEHRPARVVTEGHPRPEPTSANHNETGERILPLLGMNWH
jgi:hypothetical protein